MLLKVFIDFCPEKRAIALQDLLDLQIRHG